MIGRLHHVVIDCPDPVVLAEFYSQVLGRPVTYRSEDWIVVAANDSSSGLAFQLAPENCQPTWPSPAVPQQFRLDIMVEDVAASGPLVFALGATKLDGEDVYADRQAIRSALSTAQDGHRQSQMTTIVEQQPDDRSRTGS